MNCILKRILLLERNNIVFHHSGLTPLLRLLHPQQSLQLISEHQANNPDRTYELGLTPASADNDEDLIHRSGLLPELVTAETTTSAAFQELAFNASNPIPSAVNWVDDGAVTPVKDQGRCAA